MSETESEAEPTETESEAEPTETESEAEPTETVDPEAKFTLDFPKKLRMLLINDYYWMGKRYITRLPAPYSVSDIISDYIEELPLTQEEKESANDFPLKPVTDGSVPDTSKYRTVKAIHPFFDQILPYRLLYSFERPQFDALLKSQAAEAGYVPDGNFSFPGFHTSEHYGIVHFARLLAGLPEYMKFSEWKDVVMRDHAIASLNDFVKFLGNNCEKYFDGEVHNEENCLYYILPSEVDREENDNPEAMETPPTSPMPPADDKRILQLCSRINL